MSTYANTNEPDFDRLGRGATFAIALHLAAVGIIAGWAFISHVHGPHWGESVQQSGAIQANMVSAIPLPPKAPSVDKSVLASEDVTKVPAPQPKVTTQPPPKPEDVLIKGKTPDKAVPKPVTVTAPKHPQPTPDTPKANSGDSATQLPQSVTQTKNGTATVTIQDRVFGTRYAYYLRLVGQIVNQNYNPNEADPRASQGKSVTLVFDIERDGTVANLHLQTRSGSASLDSAAMRAIQRIDSGFGPLPAGDHITIEYKFDYRQS
jgi:protein TonB